MSQAEKTEVEEAPVDKATILYENIIEEIDDTAEKAASMSIRFFGERNNAYKRVRGIDKKPGLPAKREMAKFRSAVKKLAPQVKKVWNTKKPKATKKPSNKKSTKPSGFGRLVVCSPALSKFLGLHQWGLQSEVDPEKCICSHERITRMISNYFDLMCCYYYKDGKQYWSCPDELAEALGGKELIENSGKQAEKKDLKALVYPDLQVILPASIPSLQEDSHDGRPKSIAKYAALVAEGSDLDKATLDVKNIRERLKLSNKAFKKTLRDVKSAQKIRPGQGIIQVYVDMLQTIIDEMEADKALLYKTCDDKSFPRCDRYPEIPEIPEDLVTQ